VLVIALVIATASVAFKQEPETAPGSLSGTR
jgi:hypothetical protein